MPALVRVLPLHTKNPPGRVISTVSHSNPGLSPFHLGPCKLYRKYTSLNMENGWQYSKLYTEHAWLQNNTEVPSPKYWRWALGGWRDSKAHRYPVGKGRKPLYLVWDGEHLDYIAARKTVYVPLYARVVQQGSYWPILKKLYRTESELTLLDYDAYDHRELGLELSDVLNDPNRKMGHAFVLAMLLTDDSALEQCRP